MKNTQLNTSARKTGLHVADDLLNHFVEVSHFMEVPEI
jgi:hypothetical protein